MYEDVSPSIATKTLLRLRDELNGHAGRNKLNVEIVRPGTFEAFKEHLQRTEETRGPGYFHLVHFDTHGTVRSRKGKASKYGLLYFSDPDSGRTVLKPGVLIAKVLKKHGVQYAVLNSPHIISRIDINPTNLDEPSGVEKQLVGRDFDILRLEKRVLKSHVLYASGLIGVGKTALLKHMATVWKSTGFVQVTAHVDLRGTKQKTSRLPLGGYATADPDAG